VPINKKRDHQTCRGISVMQVVCTETEQSRTRPASEISGFNGQCSL